ncbi:MAG TPA: hypothetical protein VE223_05685 [Nitrososphaeraceae archaeon]|nr:hypothetical protein [Nitrososphaeraceae archaeon]
MNSCFDPEPSYNQYDASMVDVNDAFIGAIDAIGTEIGDFLSI